MFKKHLFLFVISTITFYTYAQQGDFFHTYSSPNKLAIRNLDTVHDGGFIMCGTDFDFHGGDFIVIRTDSLGNEQWRFTNNDFNPSTYQNDNSAEKIVETKDHGFFLVSHLKPMSGAIDVQVAKLDSSGNLQWKRQYNFFQSDIVSTFYAEDDSTILIAGRINNNGNIFFLKMNYFGDTLWSKFVSYSGLHFEPKNILKINGNYYINGWSDSASYWKYSIFKFDLSGNLIWNKVYQDQDRVEVIPDFRLSSDSELLGLANYSTLNSGNFKIITTDINGNLLSKYSPLPSTRIGANLFVSDTTIISCRNGTVDSDSLNLYQYNIQSNQLKLLKEYYFQQDCGFSKTIIDKKGRIIVLGGCAGSGNPYFSFLSGVTINPIGIEKTSFKINCKIYPNPSNNILYFEMNERNFKNYSPLTVSFFDTNGKMILTKKGISSNNFSIEVRNLKTGIYTYKIDSKENFLLSNSVIINH